MTIADDREHRRCILESYGVLLKSFPVNERDADLCRVAVAENGCAFRFVPEEHRDEDIYILAAVNAGEHMVTHASPGSLSPALCFLAVNHYNEQALKMAVERVEGAIDELTCLAAVTEWGGALEFVPPRLKTRRVCRAAVKNDAAAAAAHVPEGGYAPRTVEGGAEKCESYRHYIDALIDGPTRNVPTILSSVPADVTDYAMYSVAVRRNGWALAHVPESRRTPELCALALSSFIGRDERPAEIFDLVPNSCRTYAVCFLLAKFFDGALAYIPERHRDYLICYRALQFDPSQVVQCPASVRIRLWQEFGANNEMVPLE